MFDQFKIFMKALQAESRLRVAINSLYTGVFGENGLSEAELSTLNGSKWDVLQIIEIKEALNSVEGFMMPSLAYYEEVGKHHGVKDTLYMPVPVYCQECGENIYQFDQCSKSTEGKHSIKEQGDVRNINDEIITAHKEAEESRMRLSWLMAVREMLSISQTGRFLSDENEKAHVDDLIQQFYIRPIADTLHTYMLTWEGVAALDGFLPADKATALMNLAESVLGEGEADAGKNNA